MSKALFTGIISLFWFSTIALADESAQLHPMKQVAASMEKTYKLPKEFTSKSATKPKLAGTGLSLEINRLTREKIKAWKELILTSGEYDYLTSEEKADAIKNPAKFLKVPFLIEISEVTAVYLGEKLVGYIIQADDHVQAAIYQDGAWFNFYVDEKLNVIETDEGSA